MLVIANDLVSRSPIEIRQTSAPSPDLQKLLRESTPRALAPDALQPLFGSMADGGSDGFTSQGCEFSHGLLSGRILDIEGHEGTLAENFCL
jgi:hypothetical protein